VKELYFRAFSSALERGDCETLGYVGLQYARYLAFKGNDTQRAVEIMNQAINKCS